MRRNPLRRAGALVTRWPPRAPRALLARLLLVALGLRAGIAQAGSAHLEQARVDVKHGYYPEALVEVQAGLLEPAPDRFALYALGVDIAWELGDIDRVLQWSQLAAGLAGSPDEQDAWQARHDVVAGGWGWLAVSGPVDRATLRLEPATAILDPEDKRIAAVVLARLHRPQGLPARLPVPAGDWTLNGRPVRVAGGAVTEVALEPGELVGVRTLRVELGAGPELALRATGAQPGPMVEGALSAALAPIGDGRFALGALGRWAPVAWVDELGATRRGPLAGAFGVSAAVEEPLAGLLVRLRVAGEASRAEGLVLPCPDCARDLTTAPAWGFGPAAQLGVYAREGAGIVGVSVGGGVMFGRSLGPAEVAPTAVTRGTLRLAASVGI